MSSLPASSEELTQSLEDASVVEWFNSVLCSSDDESADYTLTLTQLDQTITALVATLDIACEDTSAHIEHIIDDTSRSVPRLTYDMQFMRDNAMDLQSSLAKVRSLTKQAVPKEITATLDQLQSLDTMKRNMEAAREVLREAESWNSLEFEVTSYLAEHAYAKAAERLSEASKSMAVFQNTAEFEPRRALMFNLQNQLEAALSSALVSAISTQDLVGCKEYYSIFSNIQRESEFLNYYNGARRASIVTLWHDTALVDCASASSTSQTLAAFLPRFYDRLLALLNIERVSMSSIFPVPAIALSHFISSTFSALQPTFPQRLSSLTAFHGASALKELVSAFQATEEFVAETEKLMEKIKFSYAFLPNPEPAGSSDSIPPPTPSHSRRRSVRMSMSWRSNPNRSGSSGANFAKSIMSQDIEGLDWDQELLQPFLDFQVDYPSLERRLLEGALDEIVSIKSDERITESDRSRLLRERVVDVVGVADGCLTRCTAFTYGYGAVGMVQAIDNFFRAFVDAWTADLNTRSMSGKPLRTDMKTTGEDLSDLDYSAQDWSDFQISVHLLASVRAVFERMSAFESKLRSNLVQIATRFRLASQDPGHTLTSSRREDQLLEQSILNSAELQHLLSSVDPDATAARDTRAYPAPQTPGLRSAHAIPPPPTSSPLLVDAREAVFRFAQTCQTSLQATLLSPLRRHLSSYAASPIWTQPGDPKSKRTVGSGGGSDIQVPTFSLSPTDTVQRVAEGLLNLPRLFEVYAEDDALSFSLSTLPNLSSETLASLSDLATPPGNVTSPPLTHLRKPSLAIPSSKPATSTSTISPEVVSSAWLSSLARSILTHLTTDILPNIESISIQGSAQLSSDLAYLSNIVSALAVDFEDLAQWTEAVSMDEEEGKKKVVEVESENEKNADDTIFWKVAKMRGWCK